MRGLSILIPVFNWDCSKLLEDLHTQGLALSVPFEIIVADDCSTQREIVVSNSTMAERLANCRLIELEHNVGRAFIRNYLADLSQYDKLLFIDCDAAVMDSLFLQRYIEASEKASVICGGLVHPDVMPRPGIELRWKYERNADLSRNATVQNSTPYDKFSTFSILIDKELFISIRFDESYSRYGYEDVQLGHELNNKGVKVLYIDNPLVHLGLDINAIFLRKTRDAIINAFEHNEQIAGSSTLLIHYNRVCKLRLKWLFVSLWSLFGKLMEHNLTGHNPSLKLFALYKLCYICTLHKE